jgi:soluble lytic murein transglycosylase-like protein
MSLACRAALFCAVVFVSSEPALADASRIVAETARRHGVPANLALAIASIESGFRCKARSRSNARGVMQVLPRTARGVGVHGNLFDCRTGAEAGMRYLSSIIRRHGVSCASVSLYNRGAHARPVCTAYGRKVMARLK